MAEQTRAEVRQRGWDIHITVHADDEGVLDEIPLTGPNDFLVIFRHRGGTGKLRTTFFSQRENGPAEVSQAGESQQRRGRRRGCCRAHVIAVVAEDGGSVLPAEIITLIRGRAERNTAWMHGETTVRRTIRELIEDGDLDRAPGGRVRIPADDEEDQP